MSETAVELVRGRRVLEMISAARPVDIDLPYPYRQIYPEVEEWTTVLGLYFQDKVEEAAALLDTVGIGNRGEYTSLRRMIYAEAETARRALLNDLSPALALEFIPSELPVDPDDLGKLALEQFEELCRILRWKAPSPTLISILHWNADLGFHLGYEMPKQSYDKVCINPITFEDGSFEGVLRHELAHVVSYNLSEALVPTWVTEGVSIVLGGQLERFRGKWRKPRELEAEFRRTSSPLRSELGARTEAYQQAGTLIQFLIDQFGFDKIHDLLRACAQESWVDFFRRSLAIGSRMDGPIRKVFGMSERSLFAKARETVF